MLFSNGKLEIEKEKSGPTLCVVQLPCNTKALQHKNYEYVY